MSLQRMCNELIFRMVNRPQRHCMLRAIMQRVVCALPQRFIVETENFLSCYDEELWVAFGGQGQGQGHGRRQGSGRIQESNTAAGSLQMDLRAGRDTYEGKEHANHQE